MIKDYGCYRKYVDSLNIRRRWWHRWKGRLQRSRPKCYIFGKIIGCGRHHLGSAQCPLLVQLGSSIGGSTCNDGKNHWYNLDVEHDDDEYNFLIVVWLILLLAKAIHKFVWSLPILFITIDGCTWNCIMKSHHASCSHCRRDTRFNSLLDYISGSFRWIDVEVKA